MDIILDVVYTKVAEKWLVITIETNIAFFFTLKQDIQLNSFSIYFFFSMILFMLLFC